MKRLALAVIVLTGCDALFNIDTIEPPPVFDIEADCTGYPLRLMPGSRYRIVVANATAWEQHDVCAADNPGKTHLAVASTHAELLTLSATLDSQGTFRWIVGAVQSRITSAPADGWMWITGEEFRAEDWEAPVEPNDEDGIEFDHREQFAVVYENVTRLVDMPGEIAGEALCECDGRPVTDAATALIDMNRGF